MRSLFTKVALLVASLLVAFTICEVATRLVFDSPQRVHVIPAADFESRMESERAQKTNLRLAKHPEGGGLYVETRAGRRLRANTLAIIENHQLSKRRIEIRTNSLGYRNPEIGPKGNATRILFLGDSITFGDYLPEDETFVRLVESRANEEGRRWETINAGVGAISLENELAILMETGLTLEPDVVVVGFYLNDFLESAGVYVGRLPWPLDQSRLFQILSRTITPSLSRTRVQRESELRDMLVDFDRMWPTAEGDFRESKLAFNRVIRRSLRDWGGAWSEQAWDRMTPLFAELKRLSQEQGFELYIVAFPVQQQVVADFVYDFPQQRLEEVGVSLAIPVLNLLPVLRADRRRLQSPLFYDQCHHTPRGATIVAEAIHAFLAKRLADAAIGRESNHGDAIREGRME